jgi:uncharacterized metal-binding protein
MCSNKGVSPDYVVYACCGACNLGQITNEAVRTLDELGHVTMGSSIAVAARNPNEVSLASRAGKLIVVDGCADNCMLKVMQNAGLHADRHVVVDVLGVETKHDFEYTEGQVAAVASIVHEAIREIEAENPEPLYAAAV